MSDPVKIYKTVWEDYGEARPPKASLSKDWLQSQLSDEPEVPFTQQTRNENPLRIPDYAREYTAKQDIKIYQPEQKKAETFGEKAQIDVENFLWDIGQGKTQGGDVLRTILPPIQGGSLRLQQGVKDLFTEPNLAKKAESVGNVALGTAGSAFGIAMSPFTIIKEGFTEVLGEDAGKIAELGTLGIAGGLPLIAGYFASEGVTGLADKISKGLDLTPQEAETVQEVTGLTAFVLGTKIGHTGQKYVGKKVNTYLDQKVNKYLDEIFPNTEKTRITGQGEVNGLKETDLWGTEIYDTGKKSYEEPGKIINIDAGVDKLDVKAELVLPENKPTELTLTPEQRAQTPREKKRQLNVIEDQIRQAEKDGNEVLWGELDAKRKEIINGKPETKAEQSKKSVREERKEKLREEAKVAIEDLLNEKTGDPSLSGDIRILSKKLNSLDNQIKYNLSGHIDGTTIRNIVNEWNKNRRKSKEQVVSIPEVPLEEVTLPGFYGKNTNPSVGYILKDNPEFADLIKDIPRDKVYSTLSKALDGKRSKKPTASETFVNELDKKSQEFTERSKEEGNKERAYITSEYEIDGKTYKFIDDGNMHNKIQQMLEDNVGRDKIKLKSKGWTVNGEYITDAKKILEMRKKPTPPPESKGVKKTDLSEKDLDDIFGKKESKEDIKKRIDDLSKKQGSKLGSLGGNIEPELFKEYVKYGKVLFEEGVRDIAKFTAEMKKDFGDVVVPYIEKTFGVIKDNSKIDDTKIKDWIDNNKQLLGLELKRVGGKIIDPTTGSEGAAKHIAKRKGSVIEFNENTEGGTWYHELAHSVMNTIRRNSPDIIEARRGDIEKIIGESDKPINEQFADAFERMFTDPNAPKTRLEQIIQNNFDNKIPKSFELRRSKKIELEGIDQTKRTKGKRAEHDTEWLDAKYDAPEGVTEEISNVQKSDAYKKLRDDGTKKFAETLAESDKYNDITKENLLTLDPKTLEGKIFNDAQQVRIERIMLNDALEVADLSRQYKSDLSRENALNYKKRVEELMILRAIYNNNGRELARALSSRRARNTISPEEYQLINEGIQKLNKTLGKDSGDLSLEMEKADELSKPTGKDIAQYIWYNLALSNPLTDIANVGGNVSSMAFIMATHPISGTKAFIHTYITDKTSWKNFGKIVRGEQHTISKYTEQTSPIKEEIFQPKTKGGNIAKHILLPTERLKAEDAIFRSFFETLAKEKSAKILAKELGVDKNEVIKVYNDFIEKKSSIDKLVSTWGEKKFIEDVEGIERWAAKMVFQEKLGDIGRPIQRVLNATFPLNLLTIPFLRIAVNLGKISLEASPYGLTKLLGREAKQYFGKEVKDMTKFEQRDLLQRAVVGTMFYTSLMALLNNSKFELTGDAPRDKNIRELWDKSGYRENSFIVNNEDGTKTAISYGNISPYNVLLGGVGTMMTKAKYSKAKDQSVFASGLDIVLGMANALGNQSFLRRTSTLLDLINKGDGINLEKFLIEAIPLPNVLSLAKGSPDLSSVGIGEQPNIYQTKGLVESVKNRIGMTNNLMVKPDVFGEDRKSKYHRFPMPTTETVNRIAKFMLERGLTIGDPGNPKEDGVETLDREGFDRYNKLYRRNFYSIMDDNFDYINDIANDSEILQSIVDNFKDEARELAKAKIKY